MKPLFPTDVARLQEALMVEDLAAVADRSEPILGGVMARSEPGSWTNHAIGLCMEQPADDDALDRLIRFYEEAGVEPRVEVCTMAHESLIRGLGARGFILKGFESVIARALDPGERIEPPAPAPEGLRLQPVDLSDDAALRTYADAIYRTFFPPDHPGPTENDLATMRRYLRKPGTVAVAATIDGAFVGGGAVMVKGDLAALTGAGVKEPFRRRGVQQHLLAERLRLAARSGARIATVGSKPGVATERNVLRMGFALSYTRAVLIRPGEGLVGERG